MNSPRARQAAMICFGVRDAPARRSARWRSACHGRARQSAISSRVWRPRRADPCGRPSSRTPAFWMRRKFAEVRRPHVEPRVRARPAGTAARRASACGWVNVGVKPSNRSQSVSVSERLHLLEHRRARIRRQDLELRDRRSEIDRVVDRRRDRVPVVLQEAEHVERRRDDAELPAVCR